MDFDDIHEQIDEDTAMGYMDIDRMNDLRSRKNLSEAERKELTELSQAYSSARQRDVSEYERQVYRIFAGID